MQSKYEISIIELMPYTEEEINKMNRDRDNSFGLSKSLYSNKPFHERRMLLAEVTLEEFKAVRDAIISAKA